MIPLIIGGVTLAAVGYAVKEYCNEEGCPWDETSSSNTNATQSEVTLSSQKSKEFYKFKKSILKASMLEHQEFLKKHNIQNHDIATDEKLQKQRFDDEQITDELKSYIKQISNTLEILSYNLSLGIKISQNETSLDDDAVDKLHSFAKSIYELSHLKLFNIFDAVNQVEILSTLVKAMSLTTQRDAIYVNLDVA